MLDAFMLAGPLDVGHVSQTLLPQALSHLAVVGQLLSGIGAHLAGLPHLAVQTVPGADNFGSLMKFEQPQFFQNLLTALDNKGQELATKLLNDGLLLLNALLLMVIAWKGIRLSLSQGGLNEFIGELFQVVFLWGIAFMFIGTSSGYLQLTKEINTGCDYIAQKVSGLSYAPGQAPSILWTGVQVMFTDVNSLFTQVQADITALGGPLAVAAQVLILGNMAAILVVIDGILKGVVAIVLLIATAMFVCVFFASQILIFISLCLGPVFIPWLIWEVSKEFFDSWFKFMLTAGFFKIIAVLILGIMRPVIDQLVPSGANAAQNLANLADLFKSIENDLALLAVAFLIAYFMLQAPRWANGILHGGAETGGIWRPSLIRAVTRATQGGETALKGGRSLGRYAMFGKGRK